MARELQNILKKISIEELIRKMKNMSSKRKFKEKGKNQQAIVLTKANFMALCNDFLDEGISEDSLNEIEPRVWLAPEQATFYRFK